MIYIVCLDCKSALRVVGDIDEVRSLIADDSEWYPDKYPCWKCSARAKLMYSIESNALPQLDMRDLTPQEAFLALSGVGLPEEQDCSVTAVTSVLKRATIMEVVVRPIRNSSRSCLDCLILSDGTKVYLGSSVHGATVYRIATPHHYSSMRSSDG